MVYYHSNDQKEQTLASIQINQSKFKDKIVTEVSPMGVFYEAEDYHQNYFNRNPTDAFMLSSGVQNKLNKMAKHANHEKHDELWFI